MIKNVQSARICKETLVVQFKVLCRTEFICEEGPHQGRK